MIRIFRDKIDDFADYFDFYAFVRSVCILYLWEIFG